MNLKASFGLLTQNLLLALARCTKQTKMCLAPKRGALRRVRLHSVPSDLTRSRYQTVLNIAETNKGVTHPVCTITATHHRFPPITIITTKVGNGRWHAIVRNVTKLH